MGFIGAIDLVGFTGGIDSVGFTGCIALTEFTKGVGLGVNADDFTVGGIASFPITLLLIELTIRSPHVDPLYAQIVYS